MKGNQISSIYVEAFTQLQQDVYLSFWHIKHAAVFPFQERFGSEGQLLVNSL